MLARPAALFCFVLWSFAASVSSHPYDMGIVFEESTNAMPAVRPQRRTTRPPHSTTTAPHSTSDAAHFTLPAFSANESYCFALGKVLYPEDGKCYKLREQGPCLNDTEWLVLDKDEAVRPGGALRPVCQTCPCCNQTLRVFWPADGLCHKLSERQALCPFQGTKLQSDPFGEGECACNKEPPHARYEAQVLNNTDAINGVCYPLYHQGPCDQLHVLTKSVLKGYGITGRCTRDPCHEQNSRNRNATSAIHAGDNRCYQLGTRGPCAADEIFNIDPIALGPQCVRRLQNIFKLPERCQTDMSGDCQQQINLKEDDKTLFALELLMSADKRKKRRSKNGLD